MKLAIIGSRSITTPNIEEYIPEGVTEIVSGGAKGVDQAAAKFARENNLKLTEILPKYERFGRVAPVVRNVEIAQYADAALVFWDGSSHGTRRAIECFNNEKKPVTIVV